jgi:hypothetical protein
MWRTLGLLLGFLAVAWFEFEIFPGHTYLASSSQLYVPMMRHLDTPGYLSRDLVAMHPTLTYTAYDEITLFLHDAGKADFHTALMLQQAISRCAALLGIFLLARAAGLQPFFALGASALIGLGAFLPGPDIWLIDREPVPRSFGFGLVLLAMGNLAREKPLLGALFGGLALLYDPAITAPFWVTLLIAFTVDKQMRTLVKPMLPVLLVFILMLANLAQLQQGTPDAQAFFSQFSREVERLEKLRTPELWVALWPRAASYLYLMIFVIGAWAATRIWPGLNRQLRWILVLMPLMALGTLPFSSLLLEHYRWSAILRVQPAQTLLYLLLLGWLVCAAAAAQAIKRRSTTEALIWCLLGVSVLVLNLERAQGRKPDPAVQELAAWAEGNTWGSSMFLFPDAGRDRYPGVFRALSRRALWVDWESGRLMNYYTDVAGEWWSRWTKTVQTPLSGDHLQQMLELPIDYYVFKPDNVVGASTGGGSLDAKPVFSNKQFAVYEASALRILPGTLTLKSRKTINHVN